MVLSKLIITPMESEGLSTPSGSRAGVSSGTLLWGLGYMGDLGSELSRLARAERVQGAACTVLQLIVSLDHLRYESAGWLGTAWRGAAAALFLRGCCWHRSTCPAPPSKQVAHVHTLHTLRGTYAAP